MFERDHDVLYIVPEPGDVGKDHDVIDIVPEPGGVRKRP